ncbi:MAG: serine/threonine-protein kinase [Pirellulales bacterium]
MDLSLESATRVWDELAVRLDEFLAAWAETLTPPPLELFLPKTPLAVRRLTLEELIKADLEQRAQSGQYRPLDDYVREFPELLNDGEPPVALIYEDLQIRQAAGEVVHVEPCLARYPRSAGQLWELLKLGHRPTATSLRQSRVHEQFAAGQQLDDFDLVALVGRGAFASVFLARQRSMQRLVALKISADRGVEHQMLAQLDHPHIVRVFDQRTLTTPKVRLLYMQFAPGGTLQDVIARARERRVDERSGRLVVESIDAALERVGQLAPEDSAGRRRLAGATWPETVCRLGIPLAQALDYAHRTGLLHRDVKPANVLLNAEGAPKLADFNVGCAAPLEGASPAAYFGGSLAYMSPEQLEACHPRQSRRPEELDGRSDLYSLAVLLWELLYGERPYRDDFAGDGWADTIDAMLERRRASLPLPPPGAADDLLTRRMQRVLSRTLAQDPQARPGSGAQLARELFLCSHPQAWELLLAPRRGWRGFLRQHPLLGYTLAIMPPNMLAGAFNYWYNEQAIIRPLGQAANQVFFYVMASINATAFPLGLIVLCGVVWPLARTLRQLGRTPRPSEGELAAARQRALRMGHLAAGVGIAEWFVAGFAFPLGMHVGLGHFPWDSYVHFFFSMLVCGAVAAAFPFFAATGISLRVYYPVLLGTAPIEEPERRVVLGLSRQSVGYLLAASGVPLLGLLLLVGSGLDNRLAALVLIVVGLAGTALAFLAHNRLRQDSLSLAMATRPPETMGLDTESLEM